MPIGLEAPKVLETRNAVIRSFADAKARVLTWIKANAEANKYRHCDKWAVHDEGRMYRGEGCWGEDDYEVYYIVGCYYGKQHWQSEQVVVYSDGRVEKYDPPSYGCAGEIPTAHWYNIDAEGIHPDLMNRWICCGRYDELLPADMKRDSLRNNRPA